MANIMRRMRVCRVLAKAGTEKTGKNIGRMDGMSYDQAGYHDVEPMSHVSVHNVFPWTW